MNKYRVVTDGEKFAIECLLPRMWPLSLFMRPVWRKLRRDPDCPMFMPSYYLGDIVLFATEQLARNVIDNTLEKERLAAKKDFSKVVYYKEGR